MSTITQELFRYGFYKPSQGRITRQVTFAAVAAVFIIGCLRLGQVFGTASWNYLEARLAEATFVGDDAKAADAASVEIVGNKGKAPVDVHKGDSLARIEEAVNAQRSKTGVFADVSDGKLHLKSELASAAAFVQVRTTAGTFPLQGVDRDGRAFGRDQSNMGFQYAIPGVLMVLGVWLAFRIVNISSFADFLIAVEAEMNKVSWPTRHELIRASLVVLLTMILLAVVLFMFDVIWGGLFHRVL